ncbi:MAG: hypothetical protein COT74_08485 [Bdellovibrionales bacterium CG10_big_fil_rev_8_21_14_0_10_45_34]|nr:MAG: hypothetical protein COT74_08485 [Bdellovibrionales bacterium CG10_big_fil_rev_8_21_14_0_10_45_34]
MNFWSPFHPLDMAGLSGWYHIAGPTKPLLVVFHGMGDRPSSFLDIQDELGIYDWNYLLLQAPFRFSKGFSWHGSDSQIKRNLPLARASAGHSIDSFLKHHGLASPIVLLGHSQGGMMALDLTLNSRIANHVGVVVISGYVNFERKWWEKIPEIPESFAWLMTHGVDDDIVPISSTRRQVMKLIEAGVPLLWEEFQKEHEMDCPEELTFVANWLRNLGHRKSFVDQDFGVTCQPST